MKKNILFALLLFIIKPSISSQDIIQNANINSSSIIIGEYVEVDFEINELRTCDNYDIDWDINYLFNEININVSYDYDDSCDESSETHYEDIEQQIVLSGNYKVYINLDFSGDISLDEMIYVADVDVESITTGNCFENSPWLDGFCPFNFDEVCGCNFITYNNECEAYFNHDIGNYQFGDCGNLIESKSRAFFCSEQYSPTESNFFENYSCDNSFTTYGGDEVIIKIPNELLLDSLNLEFITSDSEVKLFLVELDNLDECLTTSFENKLSYGGPFNPFTSYFIIADAPYQTNYNIQICNFTGLKFGNENIESTKIYPNPTSGQFYIENKFTNIEKVILTDIHGKTIANVTVHSEKLQLNIEHLEGLVFAKIFLQNQKVETKKLYFQKAP